MKNLLLLVVVFSVGLVAGGFLLGGVIAKQDKSTGSETDEPQPLYWVAPMDKNYRRDGPGLSPMGMDLVPVYEEDVSGGDDNSIKISAAVENNLGVNVSRVTKEKLTMPVDTVATVAFDESLISHEHSRVEGWIEGLGVAASGDRVSKGQTLYELYSPALVSAQEEYLAAVRSGNRNIIKASASRLYALGLTPTHVKTLAKRGHAKRTISVLAKNDGIVLALNVRKGMYIKPATEILSLASLDSVWVMGEVFERQANLVAQGQAVEVEIASMPGRRWRGFVNYLSPQLDKNTRTLAIRVRLANQDHALKPNMLAKLSVLGEASEETLSIPAQALIKAEHHQRVVKSLGEGRYQSVMVVAGLEGERRRDTEAGQVIERRIQILKGLNEGESVVTAAQFLIDSESNIDAELLRMEAPGNRAEPVESSNRVMTSGKIHKVSDVMGIVNITHEAIPAWDWPIMTMDFSIAETLELSDFKAGESIQFELEKTASGDFQITAIGDEIAPTTDEAMHHEMDHSAMDEHPMHKGESE